MTGTTHIGLHLNLRLRSQGIHDIDAVIVALKSLTARADLKQRPFQLTLRIPSSGWQTLYSIGLRIALHTAVDGIDRIWRMRTTSSVHLLPKQSQPEQRPPKRCLAAIRALSESVTL